MPYKNAEDKRRWEREHRSQRNKQRRAQRLERVSEVNHDPISDEPTNGWKTALSLGIGLGIAAIAAFCGVTISKIGRDF